MNHQWGEMPVMLDTESGIAALEREQMTKLRPMEVQGPPLHQPSSQPLQMAPMSHPAEHFALDSLTLHTIKLIQYSRKVSTMIQNVKQQLEGLKSGEGDMPTFPQTPPIPEFQGQPAKHMHQHPLPFLPKDPDSQFARGLGKPPPEIDRRTCRRLLRTSVAAICAHAGYENCAESVLEMLTDVSSEYFLQMTSLLRRAVDNEALRGSTGFPDAMVQVFHEMGIGEPQVLHDFYQTRVIKYHKHMLQSCQGLRDEYDKVRSPDAKESEDTKPSIRIKEEPPSDIQFPTLDDADENADGDHVLHLEGLGLEISIVQDTSTPTQAAEEEGATGTTGKWQPAAQIKTEISDTKDPPMLTLVKRKLWEKVQLKRGVAAAALEPVPEKEEGPSTGDVAHTPTAGSETGDSMADPGSVSTSDILSSPSTGVRASSGKPPQKKKKL